VSTPDRSESMLLQIREELRRAAHVRLRRRRRRRLGLLAAVTVMLITGTATGATRWWIGQDVTPADLQRIATTIEDDRFSDCSTGRCIERRATHKQVDVDPSMGVTFVLPSGFPVTIVPASGAGPALPTRLDDERKRFGLGGIDDGGKFRHGTMHRDGDWMVWPITYEDGSSTVIRWRYLDGRITLTEVAPDGSQRTTRLHAGDVVRLGQSR
jgi:hypothetical protein